MIHKPVFKEQSFRIPVIFLGMVWLLVCSGWVLASTSPPIPDPDRIRYKLLSFELPRVKRVLLDNGLRLNILPDKELPLVQINAVVKPGSMHDSPAPEGKQEPPPLPQPPKGNIFFLTEAMTQSIVIFEWPALAKRDAQFYPFEVLDLIVGSGGFRARIFLEIRTKQGLAYSIGIFYKANSDYGLFDAYALTKPESTVKVTTRIRNIFREMGERPVPP